MQYVDVHWIHACNPYESRIAYELDMVKYDLIKVSLVKYGQNLKMATQIWGADYHKSNQQLLVFASFPWLQIAAAN